MKKLLLFASIALAAFFIRCSGDDDPGMDESEIIIPDGYVLEWSEEFDGTAINSSFWNFETGDGTDFGLPAGWGNEEEQIYTSNPENAGILTDDERSVLAITARKEGDGYTSAKLTTEGKVSIRYGRIDILAKMPSGGGVWPALWMLGDNRPQIDWPGCGEIDIMEFLGNQPGKVLSTVHYVGGENSWNINGGEINTPDNEPAQDYHLYTLDWTPESMVFYYDDQLVHEVTIGADMKEFQRSFYLILNVAMGGTLGGDIDPDFTESSLFVDYVRVYSKEGFEAPEAPALDEDEESIGQNIEPDIAVNALKDGFDALGDVKVIAYGGGGEPVVSVSDVAVDGDQSLSFDYPGGNWGGAYLEMASPKDLSGFTHLNFSLKLPAGLADGEIKLESTAAQAPVYLKDYIGTAGEDGWTNYSIALSDFSGLVLTEVKIPFALWNPTDASGAFVAGEVLVDNIHFANN